MSSAPLQDAIDGVLNTALSCAVYDYVPIGATYPYVVIDSQLATDNQNLSSQRERIFVYLSVWSNYKGSKEVLDLMRTIRTALQNTRPTLTSGTVVNMVVTRETTDRDVDGQTFMGRVTLDVTVST